MVEKPLTLSLEDALAIRRAAREHHIHVLVNYETTWYATIALRMTRRLRAPWAICAES